MRDFNIVMFNPQPEPPASLGFVHQASPPQEPIALLLPAVQAARV